MLARSCESNSVCLSVRPFVHKGALWQNQTMHCGYFDTVRKGKSRKYSDTNSGWWATPLSSEICTQTNPPLRKRRLWQISAYNVSIVTDSEEVQLLRIGSRPPAFQRVRTYVTPKSPEGWLKKHLCFHKTSFQSYKVCNKVSLCENFQQQSCIMTIPPPNVP